MPQPIKTVPDPDVTRTRCADPVWTKQANAAKGGVPPPPTIMAIVSALSPQAATPR
jgi:hypothetical protein